MDMGTGRARRLVHRAVLVVLAQVLEPRPLRLGLDRFGVVAPDALQRTPLWGTGLMRTRVAQFFLEFPAISMIQHQRRTQGGGRLAKAKNRV